MSASSPPGPPRRSGVGHDHLRAVLQEDYDAAGTVARYAAERGLTYRRAYYRLTRAGVTLRRPGRPRTGSTR